MLKIFYISTKSLILSISKFVYTFYLLFFVNVGKNVRIDFPIDLRGKGIIRIGNDTRLGFKTFINCRGKFIVRDRTKILKNVILSIGNNAIIELGNDCILEDNCIFTNKNNHWRIMDDVAISSNCLIYSRESDSEGSLYIGKGSRISNNTIIDVCGDVRIGENVAIANNCTIFTHNHKFNSQAKSTWQNGYIVKPVIIEDGAWIGANSTILPGVIISKKSIVAAGSVVTKNVNEGEVVAGVPAKIIKKIS